ncbi:MAG: OsmC family protein [Rhodocyclaceae bacterium]|nr:OsmC family protein [Rhodocyclaceae bacterium]
MSEYRTEVIWRRGDQDFLDNRYSRRHVWRFDGGAEVLASSSPQVVPVPYSDELGVDPEEAFVAALASCHMLWFLSIAARQGYRVDVYRDAATGRMSRDERGRLAITVVTLRPQVSFADSVPDAQLLQALHGEAHEECFIANSVRTEVRCLPVFEPA